MANRKIDELESGARIEVGEHKEDPLDFALWKFAKPGEPRWAFEPYGDGRPGWHIECSAMAEELLDPDGTGFDIHGGGADLIFPHHENEIAQSEPLMARPPMANFWVHGGLLLFDNRKMAKSLGNFEPLSALLQRHDPQAIRWLFLQTGYRKVMNFTEESIAAAALGLARIKAAYRLLAQAKRGEPGGSVDLDARIEAALDDDMNTAAALAALYEFVGDAPRYAERSRVGGARIRAARVLAGRTRHCAERRRGWKSRARNSPADFVERLEDALREARVNGALDSLDGVTPQEAIERVVVLRNEARRAQGLGGLGPAARRAAALRHRGEGLEGRHDLDRRRHPVKRGRPALWRSAKRRVDLRRLRVRDARGRRGARGRRSSCGASTSRLTATKDAALRALLAQAEGAERAGTFRAARFLRSASLQSAPRRRRDRAAVSVRRAPRSARS